MEAEDNIAWLYQRLGNKIRASRIKSGLTQEGLAGFVGVKRTSITNIEKGNQRLPVHVFVAIATSLGEDPSDLLPGVPSHTQYDYEEGLDSDEIEFVRNALKAV